MPSATGDPGGVFGSLVKFRLAFAGLAQGGIEQNHRRQMAAAGRGQEVRHDRGRKERYQRGNGMKNAAFGFGAPGSINGFKEAKVIADQRGQVVAFARPHGVPAVVPEIEENEVEILFEQRPERVVQIACKAIAVAQDQAGPVGISMPAQNGYGGFVKRDLACRKRLGYFPYVIHNSVSGSLADASFV